jgi:hypothetical protein
MSLSGATSSVEVILIDEGLLGECLEQEEGNEGTERSETSWCWLNE